MKISKVLSHIPESEEQLNEGVRFTSKEKRLVDKEGHNFRIGVEYEYHLDEEFEDSEISEAYEKAVYERAYEIYNEELGEKRKSFIEKYANDEVDGLYDSLEQYEALHTSAKTVLNTNLQDMIDVAEEIESIVSEYDPDDEDAVSYPEFSSFYSKFVNVRDEMLEFQSDIDDVDKNELERWLYYAHHNAKDVLGEFYTISGYIDDVDNLFDAIPDLSINNSKEGLNEFVEAWESNYEDVFTDIQTFAEDVTAISSTRNYWEESIRIEARQAADDAWEAYGKKRVMGFNDDYDSIVETHYWETARDELDPADYSDGVSAVKWVEEQLRDFNNPWGIDFPTDIEQVDTDPSVENGVEVISEPHDLEDALLLMKQMFAHISDVGHTSRSTGMHVNVSYRGLQFTKDNFDAAKLVLLLDPKFLHNETNFPVRNANVENMMDAIDKNVVYSLATTRNADDLIEYFGRYSIRRNTKSQSINFQHMDTYQIDRNRIEFRFFGGENYEKRYDEIVNHLYRVLYTLMVAYSPTFGQKEYLKEIMKILNTKSDEYFSMSFAALVKNVRKGAIKKTNDEITIDQERVKV